jgi:hypothetical protein
MKPSSDHEREIARLVDAYSRQHKLLISSVAEIAVTIPFVMSGSESQFLVRYIVWRRDHPISMENSK